MARRERERWSARPHNLQKHEPQNAVLEELEPRVLYSAGAEVLLTDQAWLAVGAPVQSIALAEDSGAVPSQEASSTADSRRELVFVDAGTPDYQRLVDDLLQQGAEGRVLDVFVLDAGADGIAQITAALDGYQNLDAVHFVSHGSEFGVQLGATWLSIDTLGQHLQSIAGWGESLGDDADLLFYGCDLAAGEDGRALIAALADLSGADIAASDDLTGSAALGGDSELEYAHGTIETRVALGQAGQSQWKGVLNAAPVLDSSDSELWLSSLQDVSGSAAPGLADWTAGEALRFAGPAFGLGAGSTSGTFYTDLFNLDDFTGGDGNIDGMHFVTSNIIVGSGGDSVQLLTGDIILSTANDETLTSSNTLSVKSEDVFVFRPDTPGDYTSGTFIFLLDEPLGGQTRALSLVEQDTMVGGTLLSAGTFLLSEGNKEIYHFTATTVGEESTSGVSTLLVEGPDIDMDQNVAGLALVQSPTTIGGVTLSAGRILVSLVGEDNTVGSGPIDVERRDIIALEITQTGANTLGTATMVFDGSNVGLADNDEAIDAIALVPAPRLAPIIEDVSPALNSGMLVADLLANRATDADGDTLGIAVTSVDDSNGTWQYSLNGGVSWLDFGSVSDAAAIVLEDSHQIRFSPDADFDGVSTFTFRAWDGSAGGVGGDTVNASSTGGATAFSANDATGVVNVAAQNENNDAPVNVVPAPQSTTEGTPVMFSGANGNRVVIADGDAGGGLMEVSFSVDYGRLTLSGTSGLSFTVGNGTDDYSMTFTGTLSNINAALEGMTLTPAASHVGLITVQVTSNDLGNTGPGGALSDTDSFFVMVQGDAVNDAPVVDVPDWQYNGIDVPAVISASDLNLIRLLDDSANGQVLVTLTATNGTFSLNLPSVTEQQVNTYTIAEQWNPQIAMAPSGVYVVVWESVNQDGDKEGIYAQAYDADGQMVGAEFQVNTTIIESQMAPAVAMDTAGNFVIVWQSKNTDGDGFGIFAQRYSADGTRLGGETQINSTTVTDQLAPSVAIDDSGNFVVVWQSADQDGDKFGIYGALFDSNGTAVGTEFAVNLTTTDDQISPTVAMTGDGRFVVSWVSKNQDGGGLGIFARRFDAAGAPLDMTEIAVNATTAQDQLAPSVAMDGAGNFVVAWQSNGNDGDNFGIFARRFAISGAAIDVADVQINTTATKAQVAPVVSMNDAGEYVVVWQSDDQDGDKNGVYGQWFDASGSAVGGEARLNLTTLDDQTAPAVAIDANGDYVAVWSTIGQDGDKQGIFASRLWRGDAFEFNVGDGTNDALMQIVGTIDHINDLLDGLVFTPSPGFNGLGTLDITIDDQGNTGTGGSLSGSGTAYFLFNDAPVLDNSGAMSLNAIDEDIADGANIGTLVSDIIGSAGGNRITDPNGGAQEGIAVFAVDDTNGTWQYSTDGGTSWLDFGAVAAGSATLLTATANDRIRFVPNADYFGTVPTGVTFRAWDVTDGRSSGATAIDVTVNGGNTQFSLATETASIVVNPVPELPTGANNTVVTAEDTPFAFSVGDFGYNDADGDAFVQIRITSLATAGSLQLSGVDVTLNQVISVADITAGNLVFTPAPDDNGVNYDTFGFRVNDGSGDSAAAYTMTIDVTPVADLPTGADGTVVAVEDTAYVFTVGDFGYNDDDGDAFAGIRVTSLESIGSLQLSGVDVTLNQFIAIADITAGNLTFSPAANANGTGYDSFGFRVNDGTADSAAAYTLTIDVTAANDLPTGANNTVVTAEDTPYVFLVSDFGYNDIDGDGFAGIRITSLEAAGSLRLSGADITLNQFISVADITAGNLVFTPAADANGASYDSFGFRVNDGTADSAAAYTLTVDVTATNDLPTGADNTIVTAEDTPYVFLASDFGYNDIDGDGFAGIRITSLEAAGSLQLSGVDVTLNQVISVADVVGGNLTFTPAPGENGVGYAAFDFQVNDGTGYSAMSNTMTIDVSLENDLPTGADNTIVTAEDTPYVFLTSDFGYGDVDGDGFAGIRITSLEAAGSLQLSGADVTLNQFISVADITAGNLTFSPAANANGASYDSFGFRVNDGTADSAAAYTLTVDVTDVNDLPTGADNTIVTAEDTPYVFLASDFGYNDIDGDGFAGIRITSLEALGALQLSGSNVTLNQFISVADITAGNLTFSPAANANGASYDSFGFRVNDGTADSAAAYTLTVDVTAVNDLPTGADNIVVTAEDTPYAFNAADFGYGDIDGDGFAGIRITNLEAAGALHLSGVDVVLNQFIAIADITAGNLTFSPAANANGANYDSFGFRVNDGTADSVVAYTLTVDVTAVNDLPTGENNTVVTAEDTPYVFLASDFGYGDIDGDGFAGIRITSLESLGSLQLSGSDVTLNQFISAADITAGNLAFIPAADGNGANYDSFGFRVNDGTADSAAAYTLTVDVSAVNDLPTGADNTVSTAEDTPYVFLASDFGYGDLDGDGFAGIRITTLEAAGSLQLSGGDVTLNQFIAIADITAGNLTFSPAANANGAGYDSFGFRVNDGTADSAAAYTLTVDVSAVNDLPTGTDNTIVTAEDTPYVFLTSDFGYGDVDGDGFAGIRITSLEAAGSLQLSGADVTLNQFISVADITAGNLTFSPAANANGASYDSFGFRVNDGTADSAAGYTLTVDVTAVNDLPTGADNTIVTAEDTAYVFLASDFGYNDIDGDSFAGIRITSLEAAGSLQLSGADVTLNQVISAADITAGNLTFSPAANANGAGYDSFAFRVNDGTADSAAAYTLTVDVTAVNDLPTGADNIVVTAEDTPYAFNAADFGYGDIDGDGFAGIRITSLEAAGSLQLSGADVTLNQFISIADITAGNLTFSPAANANGAGYDSFGFRVNDGTADSAAAYTLTVDVTATNDLPTGADNTVMTAEDTPYVFTAADFGYSDIDGDGFAGIRITNLEAAGALQLSGVDVVLNQFIAIADITAGNLTFSPAANANGASYDSFGFRVNDGTADSAAAYTLTVDVTAVNDLPTGADNTIVTAEDTPYVFLASDFGYNDIDGDGFAGIRITSLEAVGSLQLSGSDVTLNQFISVADITAGNLTFSPAANANGDSYDSFGFRVNDGTAESTAAYTLTVDVTAVNDLPTGADNTVSTAEDTPYVFLASDFGYSDIDGDGFAGIRITTLETAGSLQLSGVDVTVNQFIAITDITAGSLTFSPAADANGASYDSFGFRVNDGIADSEPAYTITIDVTAVNDLPTGANNAIETLENVDYIFNAADFGFDDIDGDAFSGIRIVGLQTAGSLQLDGVDVALNQLVTAAEIEAGSLSYTPALDASGPEYDRFLFVVSDGSAVSSSLYTLTIDVTPVEQFTLAVDDLLQTGEDESLQFLSTALLQNDLGGSGNELIITGVGTPDHGSLTVNQNGSYTYTPDANFNGLDRFVYTIVDAAGRTSQAVVSIEIAARNDAPEGANDFAGVSAGTPFVIDAGWLLGNDTDVENQALTIVEVTQPQSGSLVDLGNGFYSYVPAPGFSGQDQFSYVVADSEGGTDVVQVVLQITAASQPPEVSPVEPEPTVRGPADSGPQENNGSDNGQPTDQSESEPGISAAVFTALTQQILPAGLSLNINPYANDSVQSTGSQVDYVPSTASFFRYDVRTVAAVLAGAPPGDAPDHSATLQRVSYSPLAGNPALVSALDRLMSEVSGTEEGDSLSRQLTAGAVQGSTVAASAAVLHWLLRGGALASALFFSLPVWMRFDPLPVLISARKEKEAEDPQDGDSLDKKDTADSNERNRVSPPDSGHPNESARPLE